MTARVCWATIFTATLLLPRPGRAQTVLFSEAFENTSYSARGWYDTSGGALSTAEHLPGSAASYECHFASGATGCSGGSPGRHLFTATDSVYLSFFIKHSASWAGSGQAYHPHMFYFLTDQNAQYVGPAYTHLTAYIEENQGYPQLAMQDGQNIDETKINQNLVGVTESRAVAGCNGVPTNIGADSVSCYIASGSTHWNGVTWKGPGAVFFGSTKTSWHQVEAYFKLNTVSSGVGQANGVVQYWVDGQLVIDHHNVILRTGAYPTMKFNQLLVGFHIGDGSPVDQTLWIDNLTVATGPPTTSPDGPPITPDGPPITPDGPPTTPDGPPVIKDSAVPHDVAVVKDTVSSDAAPGTDALSDAPADASVSDVPGSLDAPATGDTDRTTGANELSGGCGCRTTPGTGPGGWWILACMLIVWCVSRRSSGSRRR